MSEPIQEGTGAPAAGEPAASEAPLASLAGLTGLAIGVLAYVSSTMLHEAAGHGSLCLATGGQITLLDPLGMRCSVVTPAMVAAGPLANFATGALAWLALRRGGGEPGERRPGNGSHFLWLLMAFDLLIASGYLMVSGAAGFGDWAFLARPLGPAWLWRPGLVLLGAALYYGSLRAVAAEHVRLTGAAGLAPGPLRRLALFPTLAAAVVALAAAASSPIGRATALELAFGTTVVVGWSLLAIPDLAGPRPAEPARPLRLTGSLAWTLAAVAVAVLYVAVVGPGIRPHGL